MRLLGLIMVLLVLAVLALSPAVCADAASDACAHFCCTGIHRPRGLRRSILSVLAWLRSLTALLFGNLAEIAFPHTALDVHFPRAAASPVASCALRI